MNKYTRLLDQADQLEAKGYRLQQELNGNSSYNDILTAQQCFKDASNLREEARWMTKA